MDKKTPKVVEAGYLPNHHVILYFDNGERRYLPSHFIRQYVNAFDGPSEENKGKMTAFLAPPTMTFMGNEFEITEDGTVILNGKDRYSSEELWENSVKHISDIRAIPADATHWKRNIIVPVILFLAFCLLLVLLDKIFE